RRQAAWIERVDDRVAARRDLKDRFHAALQVVRAKELVGLLRTGLVVRTGSTRQQSALRRDAGRQVGDHAFTDVQQRLPSVSRCSKQRARTLERANGDVVADLLLLLGREPGHL